MFVVLVSFVLGDSIITTTTTTTITIIIITTTITWQSFSNNNNHNVEPPWGHHEHKYDVIIFCVRNRLGSNAPKAKAIEVFSLPCISWLCVCLGL